MLESRIRPPLTICVVCAIKIRREEEKSPKSPQFTKALRKFVQFKLATQYRYKFDIRAEINREIRIKRALRMGLFLLYCNIVEYLEKLTVAFVRQVVIMLMLERWQQVERYFNSIYYFHLYVNHRLKSDSPQQGPIHPQFEKKKATLYIIVDDLVYRKTDADGRQTLSVSFNSKSILRDLRKRRKNGPTLIVSRNWTKNATLFFSGTHS